MAFSLTPFIGIQSDTLYWHTIPLLAFSLTPFIGMLLGFDVWRRGLAPHPLPASRLFIA